jgi:hypothetical protein
MTKFKATMIVEGVEPCPDEETYIEACQLLIDTGLAWQLQGFFGRTCAGLIESGHCHHKAFDPNDPAPEDWDGDNPLV